MLQLTIKHRQKRGFSSQVNGTEYGVHLLCLLKVILIIELMKHALDLQVLFLDVSILWLAPSSFPFVTDENRSRQTKDKKDLCDKRETFFYQKLPSQFS